MSHTAKPIADITPDTPTLPTLPDELFRYARTHTSQLDRTEDCRRDYEGYVAGFISAGGESVDQGDVDRLSRAYSAWLSAQAGCSSVLVTGPSGRNVQQAEKRNATERKRYEELDALRSKLLKAAGRRDKAAATAAAGGEVGQTRTRLAEEVAYHALMKAANRIVKVSRPQNVSTPAKIEKLVALGMTESTAAELFVRAQCSYGFPSYAVALQNDQVKRTRAKLAQLEALEADRGREDDVYDFDGGVAVTLAHDDDRIRITFDRRPAKGDPRIAVLKSSGWKWSPREGSWQRKLRAGGKLSRGAIDSAESALGVSIWSSIEPSSDG